MKIEIIGPGCPFCRRLYKRVNEVVLEQGIKADVYHIKNIKTVFKYLPRTPVLIINNEIVHRGKIIPNKEKIIELLALRDD